MQEVTSDLHEQISSEWCSNAILPLCQEKYKYYSCMSENCVGNPLQRRMQVLKEIRVIKVDNEQEKKNCRYSLIRNFGNILTISDIDFTMHHP